MSSRYEVRLIPEGKVAVERGSGTEPVYFDLKLLTEAFGRAGIELRAVGDDAKPEAAAIPADRIKCAVASPITGLTYVSDTLWRDPTTRIRERGDAGFHLADRQASPRQWAEAVKVFPDLGDFRPGDHDFAPGFDPATGGTKA